MIAILAALGAAFAALAPTAAAAAIGDDVTVAVEETADPILLGETLDLTVTVANDGTAATAPLVLHIDITDLGGDGSVDPEDWTSTLSKPIGEFEPGQSSRIDWRVQPISGGNFTLYAVALSSGAGDLAASNVITIDVTDQRSLNPNGILPAAIGTPAIVGALLVVQFRRSRRFASNDGQPSFSDQPR